MAKAKKRTKSVKLAKKTPMKKATAKKAIVKKIVKKVVKKTAPKKAVKLNAKPSAKPNAKPSAKANAKPRVKPISKPTSKSTSKSTSKPSVIIDYAKVVTPLGDRLIVRLVSVERVTPGGLIIPDTVTTVQGHLKGEVLAAGTGNRNKKGQKRPLDVSVGDQIYFAEHSSTKMTFGLEELHIVNEADVLGVAQ